MASRQEQFAAQVEELLRESRNVSRETAVRVFRMLEDARQDIVARIAASRPESFTSAQLNAMLAEVDRQMRDFGQRAGFAIGQAQERQWRLGEELVDRPLAQIGALPTLARLERTRLVLAQGYSATLVTGLSREVRSKLDAELRRSLLGGQQIGDIVGRITKLLDGATGRAETIAFTEINRMQSIATQERMEQVAQKLGSDFIKKEWRHNNIGVPRPGHVRLHGTAIPVNALFEVEEYFDANGQKVGSEFLRYPRDPQGSARNTINCHCTIIPKVEVPAAGSVPKFGRLELVAA